MDAHLLIDARCLHGLLEHGLGTPYRVRATILSLKQVLFGLVFHVVLPQLGQDTLRQVHIAVLLALAPGDQHLHVAAVDVLELEARDLRYAQAHAVTEPQQGVVLQIGGGLKQLLDVPLADVLGQGAVLLGPWDLREEFFPVQHLLEVELDGVEPAVQRGFAQIELSGTVQHVAAQPFGREAVHGQLAQEQQELRELVAVGVLRMRAVPFQPKGFHQALQGGPVHLAHPRQGVLSLPLWEQSELLPMVRVIQHVPGLFRTRPSSARQLADAPH